MGKRRWVNGWGSLVWENRGGLTGEGYIGAGKKMWVNGWGYWCGETEMG